MTSTDKKRAWFFQANPKKYNIQGALSKYKVMTWEVTRYFKQIDEDSFIKKGDIALIWVSGSKAGIYATAEVIEDPRERAIYPDAQYCHIKPKEFARRALLEIKPERQNPISREELIARGITLPPISEFYQATNFVIDKETWEIIKVILANR
ncbi:MAG: EVE domain-containing protein [Candidatus Delongbacteria bacterium]|nr:EVE domain-containing protein [Candidatus Delongbacteria bacterium]